MKSLVAVLIIGIICSVTGVEESFDTTCIRTTGFPKEVCEDTRCSTAVMDHIKNEFNAAFKYMYMASHFAQDFINRPGLAKFLFEAASEERGHGIQMLDYLNLRGIKLDNIGMNITTSQLPVTFDYQSALEEAINMEIEVTKMIYDVVAKCEKDYHGADVFTNPILDEQHDGVRKLQGAYRTFLDMAKGYESESSKAFAEYMFDMKLLNGEIM